jgi:sodium-coupled neutral amino acid transporter 11
MHVIILVLACLRFACHGRRVQSALDPLDLHESHEQRLGENQVPETLLFAMNPVIGYDRTEMAHISNRHESHVTVSITSGQTLVDDGGNVKFRPALASEQIVGNDFSRASQPHMIATTLKSVGQTEAAHTSPPVASTSVSFSHWRTMVLGILVALSGLVSARALQSSVKQNPGYGVSRAPAPVLSAGEAAPADEGTPLPSGKATMSASIVNLSKNIVGSGVLALASGVAAFSASPIGVVPALAALLVFGGLSAYTFSLIARVGTELGVSSYSDAWGKLFGERASIIPASTIIFKTLVGGLAYCIILGDSFASIASLAGLPVKMCSSNTWILAISAFVLLPLSLLRDLSSLAIGSLIGTAGTIYTALFMGLRLLDNSYAAGGRYYAAISESARPAFAAASASHPLLNPAFFVLISMLSSAFLAHYNAPKFYQELAQPEDGGSKNVAFTKVVAAAFAMAAMLSAAIMAGGYLTFGGASQGLILNSYATSDPLAFLARIGICSSVLFSYPLIFVGLRDGVLNLLKLDGSKNRVHVISTVLLLCFMNGISLVLKNLGLVVAVGGAVLGSSLVYIFPAMMFIKATCLKKKEFEAQGKKLPAMRMKEMYANYGLVGLGITLAVLGVKMSLKSFGS